MSDEREIVTRLAAELRTLIAPLLVLALILGPGMVLHPHVARLVVCGLGSAAAATFLIRTRNRPATYKLGQMHGMLLVMLVTQLAFLAAWLIP